MKGLIERTISAEATQERINDWPRRWRLRIWDHKHLMVRLLHRANLETYCTTCGAVMDTAINHVDCLLCGSADTCSPYYC